MRWAAEVLLENGQYDLYGDNRSWYEKGAVGFVWNHRETILGVVAVVGYALCAPTSGAGCVVGALASAAGTVSAGQRAWTNCGSDLTSYACGGAVVSTGLGLVGAQAGSRTAALTSNKIASSPVLSSPVFRDVFAPAVAEATIRSARVWSTGSLGWSVVNIDA